MRYVDGFVLPVPKNKLAAYKKLAAKGGKMWMKHGALQYIEAVGDDLNAEFSTLKFGPMAKAKPNETVVFSFIVYKSRKHRDLVNAKVMKDPSMQPSDKDKKKTMPFDMKRLAYGGFKALVDL